MTEIEKKNIKIEKPGMSLRDVKGSPLSVYIGLHRVLNIWNFYISRLEELFLSIFRKIPEKLYSGCPGINDTFFAIFRSFP
jgi:hypothetical protein